MADLLVVEDDETIGTALTSGLRSHGHAVSWQRTGRSAMRPPAAASTSSSWISGCPTWTAWRCAGACGSRSRARCW